MKLKALLIAIMTLVSCVVQAQKIVFMPQWIPQSQFAGYYVAQKMGFYEEVGVEVEIRHSSASDFALNSLLKGECQAITIQLFDAIYQIDKGVEMVNILQTAQRSGHVIVIRHDDIESIDDLKGRRVGIWRSSFGQLAQLMNMDHKLGIEWIPFVQSINLYISGAVDATMAMTYNELYWILSSGFEDKKVIAMADIGYDYPEEGIYISKAYYEKYPDKARAFAEASQRGWEWAHQNPEQTLEIVLEVMSKEQIPASRKHQQWMLREVLKMQCRRGEDTPSFCLDSTKVEELNQLLLKHERISQRVSVEQIQGSEL